MDTPTPETATIGTVTTATGTVSFTAEHVQTLLQLISTMEREIATYRRRVGEAEVDKEDAELQRNYTVTEMMFQYSKTMLPLIAATHPSRMTCCYCMEDVSVGDKGVFVSPCGHVFHIWSGFPTKRISCEGPYKQLMEPHPTCPVCRADLPAYVHMDQEEAFTWTSDDDAE